MNSPVRPGETLVGSYLGLSVGGGVGIVCFSPREGILATAKLAQVFLNHWQGDGFSMAASPSTVWISYLKKRGWVGAGEMAWLTSNSRSWGPDTLTQTKH